MPRLAKEGITLARGIQPAITYSYFNMDDPVVGGYTPEKVALRRAIGMAYNVDEEIRVLRAGQAERATQPLPPNVTGYNPKFDGLRDDADPVTAPSAPFGGTFTIPTTGVRERVTHVPRFVSVKGGAYFFLPGLAAVRYLAGMGGEPGNSSSPVGS